MTAAATAWVLAALVVALAAGDAWSQDAAPPTVVRRAEAPLCDDLRAPSGLVVGPPCVCAPGAFCMDRRAMEAAEAIRRSEEACRGDLEACREQPPSIVEQGWQDWEVALLAVGVGLGAAGLGVGIGVAIAKL